MSLSLYNTLTRRKEAFEPIDPANVRMYVCGPTVYDLAHIGNARPIIVFDVLFRLLRHIYGETHVTYARNITDLDDKINARAVERFPEMDPIAAIRKLTGETIEQFHKDIAALGVLPPTVEPRATDYIKGMRTLCVQLVAKGHAYVAEDHVLFHVPSMPDYGKLSGRSLDDMLAGARIDVAPYKRDPMDFVLWKPSPPGVPAWPSPCGIAAPGRPGWHIECSAMAGAHLGDVFDIHGGGIDLVFPHHENELAQSSCAHGTQSMANVWMYNGFLQVEGEKMSKSLGNFVTINELLTTKQFGSQIWAGEVLRWAMLMTHYREPINWSVDRLIEARRELSNWSEIVVESTSFPYPVATDQTELDEPVVEALKDDLNTPLARSRLQLLAKQAANGDRGAKRRLCKTINWLGIFRPELSAAYKDSSWTGRAIRGDLVHKYCSTVLDARAIILNEYQWQTADHSVRLASRSLVESKINLLNPDMLTDGVAFELSEHGVVALAPRNPSAELDLTHVETLVSARAAARRSRDFKESDRIRDELAGMGIQLKDAKNPATGEIETTWEVKR